MKRPAGWHFWKHNRRTGEKECLTCGLKLVKEEHPDPYTPTMRRFWLFADGRKERAGSGCTPPLCKSESDS